MGPTILPRKATERIKWDGGLIEKGQWLWLMHCSDSRNMCLSDPNLPVRSQQQQARKRTRKGGRQAPGCAGLWMLSKEPEVIRGQWDIVSAGWVGAWEGTQALSGVGQLGRWELGTKRELLEDSGSHLKGEERAGEKGERQRSRMFGLEEKVTWKEIPTGSSCPVNNSQPFLGGSCWPHLSDGEMLLGGGRKRVAGRA